MLQNSDDNLLIKQWMATTDCIVLKSAIKVYLPNTLYDTKLYP